MSYFIEKSIPTSFGVPATASFVTVSVEPQSQTLTFKVLSYLDLPTYLTGNATSMWSLDWSVPFDGGITAQDIYLATYELALKVIPELEGGVIQKYEK